MNHSQMLTTRRRKKKAQKDVERLARQARKLRKESVAVAGANAGKKGAP